MFLERFQKGLSLRKLHSSLIVIAVALSGLTIYSTIRMSTSFMDVRSATAQHIALDQAVHRLMEASDYLTENAQRFTINGDTVFLDMYFGEAINSKRRDRSLHELAQAHQADEALVHLKEAMANSIRLMDLEYYAMRLVIEAKGIAEYPEILKSVQLSAHDAALSPEGKMRRATKMVLDDEYYRLKNRIRNETHQSVEALEKLTQSSEDAAMDVFLKDLGLSRALVLMMVASILFAVWLTARLGIGPILGAITQIKADKPIPEAGASEFRYLAQAYNKMYSAYKGSIKQLDFKAHHDELTGAFNRAGFNALMSGAERDSIYLIEFDLDNFKGINDNYGHDVGDRVLQRIVRVLKANFRSEDHVCRLGGDEFAVIMSGSGHEPRELLAGKIEKISRELLSGDGDVPPISVSAGIVHGSQASSVEKMMQKADVAMYESKRRGKNTCTFYEAPAEPSPAGQA